MGGGGGLTWWRAPARGGGGGGGLTWWRVDDLRDPEEREQPRSAAAEPRERGPPPPPRLQLHAERAGWRPMENICSLLRSSLYNTCLHFGPLLSHYYPNLQLNAERAALI